jgi:site-specific DNA-methyltransferase (adenine-specific)
MLLLKGDCLELMKNLPDKSVDLFICDLPYGCLTNNPKADGSEGKSKGGLRARYIDGKDTGTKCDVKHIDTCAWDIKLDLNAFWIQVKRLCKNDHTPVLMFCSAKFGYDLIKSNEDWFRHDLIWSKPNAVGFLSANKMPMRSHELIYVFSKKGATYYRKDIYGDFPAGGGGRSTANWLPVGDLPNIKTTEAGRRCVKSVIEVSNKKQKGGHPTAKPVELYKWLIERYSKENDMVLDPTFGSGNSGRACAELKRRYTGIEMNEKFFNSYNNETCIPAAIDKAREEDDGGV